MRTVWTNEAVDAALSQLKASRFATGMSHKEAIRQVLCAAEAIQQMTVCADAEPSPIISSDGIKAGDWTKGDDGKWTFIPIYYD